VGAPARHLDAGAAFTHTAQPSDPKYAGWLGGALILGQRTTNVAPQAIASTSARDEAATLLNNARAEQWNAWDNGKEGAAQSVTPARAEWVMLTWPRPVPLSGVQAVWAGFTAAEVQVFTGPDDRHPREATDTDWRTINSFDKLENGYPVNFWPNTMPFGETITTRAVRLRITTPTTATHPHLKNNTKEGRRIWLGELMATQPLGDADLQDCDPAEGGRQHASADTRAFHASRGRPRHARDRRRAGQTGAQPRLRNTISRRRERRMVGRHRRPRPRPRRRPARALSHPRAAVAPGTYRVRGLFHRGLDLRFEFSIYNAGNPAWSTADTAGGWLTNHTPPQAALFVPAIRRRRSNRRFTSGSAVSEGGAGLAWVDREGRKLGRPRLDRRQLDRRPVSARDAGAKALATSTPTSARPGPPAPTTRTERGASCGSPR
jgi:hypothetical protein